MRTISSTRREIIATLAVVALSALSIVAPPVLPTTDGPNHVYNAIVERDVAHDVAPYAGTLELRRETRLAPNRATSEFLNAVGPALGWESAERLLLLIILLCTFALLVSISRSVTTTSIALAAILSHHWFAWNGFFDFSLSVIPFLSVVALLATPLTQKRVLLLLLSAIALFFTHVFTMAVTVGLVICTLLWRVAVVKSERKAALLLIIPFAALFITAFNLGGTAGGSAWWGVPLKSVLGLIIGDFVLTFDAFDIVAGTVLMTLVWFAAARIWKAWQSDAIANIDIRALCGIALLLFSVVAPEGLANGSFICARLRFLGALCVLPAIVTHLPTLKFGRRLAPALFSVFLIHVGFAIKAGTQLSRDLQSITVLMNRAGVREGDWIRTNFRDGERGLYRVTGYAHLADRVAYRRRLLLLDNYQVYQPVFALRWTATPDQLDMNRRGSTWFVKRSEEERRWTRNLFVLHEAAVPLRIEDGCLNYGLRYVDAGFAVSVVQPACDQAPVRPRGTGSKRIVAVKTSEAPTRGHSSPSQLASAVAPATSKSRARVPSSRPVSPECRSRDLAAREFRLCAMQQPERRLPYSRRQSDRKLRPIAQEQP